MATKDRVSEKVGASRQPDYRWQRGDLRERVLVSKIATFVGIGGFGAWAALFATLAGSEEIVLIDPGTVDECDLARSPYAPAALGTPKVHALGALLRALRPGIKVHEHHLRFDGEAQASLLAGLVFIGVSNDDVDRDLWVICGTRGLKCVSGVYSGTEVGTFMHRPETLKIVKDGPVWVGSAALSGLLAVHSAFVEPLEFFGSISSLDGMQKSLDIGDKMR